MCERASRHVLAPARLEPATRHTTAQEWGRRCSCSRLNAYALEADKSRWSGRETERPHALIIRQQQHGFSKQAHHGSSECLRPLMLTCSPYGATCNALLHGLCLV